MSDLDELRDIRRRAAGRAHGAHDRAVLLAMVDRYRQAFLNIATAAGADTSDLTHPDQLVTPSIDEMALAEVLRLHADYREALGEV